LESTICLNNPPIFHRDLKPQNILITDGIDGKFVKITYFGISTTHEKRTLTEDIGTAGYITLNV